MKYQCEYGYGAVLSESWMPWGAGDCGSTSRSTRNEQRSGETTKEFHQRQCNDERHIRYTNDGLGPLFKDPATGKSMYAEDYWNKYGRNPTD